LKEHQAGFVNIIGQPNVGKSTLINLLMGEKMSIVSHKPQTTRHRILGILNEESYQIVFSDSPGIIAEPNYELQRSMNKFAYSSLEDADILILMTDVFHPEPLSPSIIQTVEELSIPRFLIINKIDLVKGNEAHDIENTWKAGIHFQEVFTISALNQINTSGILPAILHYLPECPPYFPKDQLSDRNERFFVSEIIREKILLLYKQEIPYSVEVEVIEFRESTKKGEDFIHIFAHIYVARKTQKGILIGKQGQMIKKLGIESRKSIEEFFKKKVHLELYVKILDEWRDDSNKLKRFGYQE
jgi:GTP-binding protein Era